MFPQTSRKFTGNSPPRNNETSRSCRSPKNHKFRGQGSDTTSFVVTPPLTSTELQILSFPPALRGNERRAHLSGEHALVDKQRGSKAPKQPLKIFNPNVIEITTKVYSWNSGIFIYVLILSWPEVSLEKLQKIAKVIVIEKPPKTSNSHAEHCSIKRDRR